MFFSAAPSFLYLTQCLSLCYLERFRDNLIPSCAISVSAFPREGKDWQSSAKYFSWTDDLPPILCSSVVAAVNCNYRTTHFTATLNPVGGRAFQNAFQCNLF